MPSASPFVVARGIAKSFGGAQALKGVSLDIRPGEVHGLVGANGAGKSTLIRILAGLIQPDAGTVEIDGRPVAIETPHRATELGMNFIHQELAFVPGMTVLQNIMLGIQARRGWLRKVRKQEQDAVVAEYIKALGVRPADPNRKVGDLSGGNQQKVLLGRWLATAPELLILDEPTRGIDVGAKADIQRKVAELAEQGLAVIFISSELEEVLRLAQRVAVMRDRRQIGVLESSAVDVDGVIEYMATVGEGSVA